MGFGGYYKVKLPRKLEQSGLQMYAPLYKPLTQNTVYQSSVLLYLKIWQVKNEGKEVGRSESTSLFES